MKKYIIKKIYNIKKKHGYVYCAINLYMKGIVKIGATEICPIKRVKELGNYTGCPGSKYYIYILK